MWLTTGPHILFKNDEINELIKFQFAVVVTFGERNPKGVSHEPERGLDHHMDQTDNDMQYKSKSWDGD